MTRRPSCPVDLTTNDEDDNGDQNNDNGDNGDQNNDNDNANPENEGKKKAPNYTEPEDYELCRAWVQVSEDPAVGTNQDGGTFWQRISTVYHEAVPRPIRPVTSLKKRWSNNVQPPINKFRGIVHQVEALNQSGASTEDQLNRALRLYAADQLTHFKHLRCYNLLVKSPKWNSYCRDNDAKEAAKKKRARSPSSEAPPSNQLASTPAPSDPVTDFEGTGTDPSPMERPIGKKKAKTLIQIAAKEQVWKDEVASAHGKIASESKRLNDIFDNDSQSLKAIAQNSTTTSQLAIMNTNLEGLDDEQKEYFKLKRAAILKSLREEANSSSD
ncbi:uncharacterized protein PGTG_20919 [Puccinia graminis f. sp. tritici CRL 75-36-700-3]|uniref:No apical meristem-associated C-terminal domain-containing protein n=1 Tax=Puccinia graminis f. sp. tritici (strain CRL 75-36-700-3 / race SCCL) TaxID=418459 RepID=H6QPW9_PUCGT|nr:uncharacterized protein PGTG_21659 [Puccinia graminis f. sp. tritici CRL 75-36-700-3]XP_003890463.1 uncharacterized protein PGTG_20919 [Puccinia graminis f. sp. tritici CRL 75-36-700-3]EHS63650.1 hypothetical protein PGTG_21659 [Puccinia graminis f. sp. tritici CRL 75-36-700-3]EHS64307.1 hypothetical protein PGTG_20919 [Puccinia graminis f. sp. tritici CRL 75-36-700-3]